MANFQDTGSKLLARLSGLSLSQRLAIGLAAALVAVSLVWLGQWAASPEMVPLLPQDLKSEEIKQIQAGLALLRVPSKVVGARVLVPASENRAGLIAQLGASEQLPSDTSVSFESLVKEANPWISQEENNKRWTVALQNQLQRVLRQLGDVKDAHVLLNLTSPRRGFSRNEPESSASVTLIMKGGQPLTRQLALGAARIVAGAVRGLLLRNVQVIDGAGAAALDWDSEQTGTGSALDRLRREQEKALAEKIRRQIDYDPGVRVSVRIEVDPTAREKDATLPSEGVETSTSVRNRETIRGARASQPGVQPNVGAAAGGGALEERTLENETSTQLQPGTERTREVTAAGVMKESFASIAISHSFLVGIFKRMQPDTTPTAEQIEAVFQKEREKVVRQVRNLVTPQEPNQVAVDWYFDALELPATTSQPTTNVATIELLERYGPASGLALLALAAIGFMLRMARSKTSAETLGLEIGLPREALAQARRAAGGAGVAPREAVELETAEAVAAPMVTPLETGEEADSVLEARELDESTMQLRGMLEQVSHMADAEPDAVAALLEKWIDAPRPERS